MAVWGGWCDSQKGSHSLLPAEPTRRWERGTAFRAALTSVRLLFLCFALPWIANGKGAEQVTVVGSFQIN